MGDGCEEIRGSRQNEYFIANCMMRGSPTVGMRPKFALLIAVTGSPQLFQLNTLNVSTRPALPPATSYRLETATG